MDKGWAAHLIQYGGGLFPQSAGNHYIGKPPTSDPATSIGHGGHTYGFQSYNGYFPHLKASMSIISN